VLREIRQTLPFLPYDWRAIAEGARFYGRLDRVTGSSLRRRFLRDQYVLSILEARAGQRRRVYQNVVAAFVLDPVLGGSMLRQGLSWSVRRGTFERKARRLRDASFDATPGGTV
jgi:hypothetical protein